MEGDRLMYRIVLLASLLLAAPAVAAAQVQPYPTAPTCPTHNNRAWHGLWDAQRGCHYNHHHGDNPHEVDGVFGTTLFGIMGGEVSHPWQTFNADGYENDLKHAGYFWHVRRNLPCESDGCITDFRILVHQHPTGRDAPVRFHSGVLEAAVLDRQTGLTGSIRVPGLWIDFGDLLVDGNLTLDVAGNGNRHKQHHSSGTPQIIWYGASQADNAGRQGFVRISTSVHDVWDHTTAANPGLTTDYACYGDPRCRANATQLRPHLITVSIPGVLRGLVDPDRNGLADWTGWTNRYGVPTTGCSRASLDCVPVTISRVRTNVSYVCDRTCASSYRDYDVYFNRQTSGWSQPVP
jgi:hypothetical protein